ncbi:polyketide synthase [Xylariaceae sp. FL0594]|nr:polyketide synthase [Xylariaceae sp. FL0594]
MAETASSPARFLGVVETMPASMKHEQDDSLFLSRPSAGNGESSEHKVDLSMSRDEDPICIVGLACRLPGEVNSPSELWDFISKKKTAQGPVPDLRFNMNGFFHPNHERQGTMNAQGGYFMSRDVRLFENDFFGINNHEATYMDPQQRQLLEVAFECFENAGLTLEEISGSNTGVYVGNFTIDFQTMQARDPDYSSRYIASGEANTILANRISHVFNLHGPSLALDTACSSSLYCLHTAVRAVQAGDCEGAIVAGVNLIISPEQHLGTSKAGVLSPTSTCHTFDISADGYGRAEAVNAVYIRRLSHAVSNGDKIWAVIRGIAVNDNGRTPGISQPSAVLQEAVIRKAYSEAGVGFDGTDYVECHGTGTAIGDPIEVDAIASCFCPREEGPLWIGSVKTNLGHSEAASGLTSIIKVALAFEKGAIPPTFGVQSLNPKLQLETRNMRVVTSLQDWPRKLRRASVNAFGFGGANAHVILEAPRSYLNTLPQTPQLSYPVESATFVLPVSAHSKQSLEARVQQISELVSRCDDRTFSRVAFTLTARRSHLRRRDYVLVKRMAESEYSVVGCQALEPPDVTQASTLPFAFIFTGQGAQYAEMAKDLLSSSKTFARTISELDSVLHSLSQHAPDWTLAQTIMDPPEISQVDSVIRAQPLCTAVQIGLVRVLADWDITPVCVVGHSSGEIAAAYAAGLLTASQATIVAYYRGYAVTQLSSPGLMIAAGLGPDDAQLLIREKNLNGHVHIGCVNASNSVTLTGSHDEVVALEEAILSQRKFVRRLDTGGRAYHSHMMKEVGALYEKLLVGELGAADHFALPTPASPDAVKMFSSVADVGGLVTPFRGCAEMAAYWRKNLENPVHFNSAVGELVGVGKHQLIEIGPSHALKGPIQRIREDCRLSKRDLPYNWTLKKGQSATTSIVNLAGSLFVRGCKLDWQSVNPLPKEGLELHYDLPNYPWDYTAGLLWHEPRASRDLRNRKHIRHELLGSRQLADDGVTWHWRNILHLGEISWLQGHKVEGQIVFPAAGYLAVVMEAISQIQGSKDGIFKELADQDMVYTFREVHIVSALVIPDEEGGASRHTELHTSLTQRKLSAMSSSTDWYDFTISSWQAGQAETHCVGGIRLESPTAMQGSVMISDGDEFEHFEPAPWYAAGRDLGIHYEDEFRMLTSLGFDGNRERPEMVCTLKASPLSALKLHSTFYPMHPITIDACLQAPIIGCSAGNISRLQPFLPVYLSGARIHGLSRNWQDWEGCIHTRSTKTGPSTQRVDATLWDPHGRPFIDIKDARLTLYNGGKTDKQRISPDGDERYPCLRAQFKADILRLPLEAGSLICQNSSAAEDVHIETIRKLLDLAGHKKPNMRVLALPPKNEEHAKNWIQVLDESTGFPRFTSWSSAVLDEDGQIHVSGEDEGPYDVIVIPEFDIAERCWAQASTKLISLSGDAGVFITCRTETAVQQLRAAEFDLNNVGGGVLVGTRFSPGKVIKDREVIIVHHQPSSAVLELEASLSLHLKQHARKVLTASLDDMGKLELGSNMMCVSLVELEDEFLASMGDSEMDLLRSITDKVSDLLWVTGASLLSSVNPRLTLSYGLSRTLMLEQPSLRFSTLDIGTMPVPDLQRVCESLVSAIVPAYDKDDNEFVLVDGLLHISRFGPEHDFNELFRWRTQSEGNLKKAQLGAANPAQLSIGRVGVLDTIHFQQLNDPVTPLPADFVEVDVKAVGLNAKDIYTLNGRVETRCNTTCMEFGGIVVAAGHDVEHLRPGDRVLVLAPSHFRTVERVPAWAAHKLLPSELFTTMVSLPAVYSTALYALKDRAQLRAGETILIHSGAGGLGHAAVRIAQAIGAIVYTTVNPESAVKREYLMQELGIPSHHIFSSRDASFAEGINAITNGKGVDVVLNSLTGELMHASWDCIAQFGRFVEVGKRELVDDGKLNMRVFLRSVTFTAFDLSELFYSENKYHKDILSEKVTEVLELYRTEQIRPAPVAIFDVSDIVKAYRYFSLKDRLGKIVVSLEQPETSISVSPPKYLTNFDPAKVYLLVGCLGGLGRSLTRWMMGRGARNFCFLGRTGDAKPSARALTGRLRKAGANVIVVRGDVSCMGDVVAAIAACEATGKPIGGVVQAAMALKGGIFTGMTGDAWQTAIQPKYNGSWNLHDALEGHDAAMDFFLLTSSLSGSLGTAAESNYCTANSFLDAFARYRRSRGKLATSVGLGLISEVGYMHENPDLEAMLLRRGIQPLSEEEFLQVIDLSISGTGDKQCEHWVSKDPEAAHILTGLEPFEYRKLVARGFDISHEVAKDPRFAILAARIASDTHPDLRSSGGSNNATADFHGLETTAHWFKSVSSQISNSLLPENMALPLQDTVVRLVKKRFSNLVLMPADQVDEHKPLLQYGVDSMIGSELRTWFWATLKVDIPLLDFLRLQKSLYDLANMAVEFLEKEGRAQTQ